MRLPRAQTPMLTALALALTVTATLVLEFRSPRDAANLDIVPDSIEYAAAAHRTATLGEYTLIVNGRPYPPRYTPWFSWLCLAPAYWLLGPNVGNAIWPITLSALLAVLLAFRLGWRLAGLGGAVLGSSYVLALPLFNTFGRLIMTEVPCAMLVLLAALLFLRLHAAPNARPRAFLLAGGVVALAAALRVTAAALLLPCLWLALRQKPWTRRLPCVAACGLPWVLVACANLAYNAVTFGSPLRSGYHFWCPVPYDYPALTFSLAYIRPNAAALVQSGLPLFLGVVVLLAWLAHRPGQRAPVSPVTALPAGLAALAVFTALSAVPLLLLHLVYFFPDARFYLPVLVLLAVIAGAQAARVLPRVAPAVWLTIPAVLLLGAAGWRLKDRAERPCPRAAVEAIGRYTPANAVVLSSIAPAYLEFMLSPAVSGAANRRQIIPLSRRVEYADKLIRVTRVARPHPFPAGFWDQRCAGLRGPGAIDVVPVVLAERPPLVAEALARGRRVFVCACDLAYADTNLLARLAPPLQLEATPSRYLLEVKAGQ